MDDIQIMKYCELLSSRIVAMYGVSKEMADEIVERSVIHDLIRDAPEWGGSYSIIHLGKRNIL